jgi:hypothetical protein
MNSISRRAFPQGLKLAFICGMYGTDKSVPFQSINSIEGSLRGIAVVSSP